MSGAKLQFGRVRIALSGAGWAPQRAQAVTKLAFRHVQELMAREDDAYVREQCQRILESIQASAEIY